MTAEAVAHLTPEYWAVANDALVRKALAELSHERLLRPRGAGDYVVDSDDGTVEYRFAARRLALDHWQVGAITRRRDGTRLPLDALEFVLEFRHTLGIGDAVLPVYLEEIASTLASRAYQASRPAVRADALARADFQVIEAGMTEGHPCFLANSGRLGFDAAEYLRYAPEAAAAVRLMWVAARRERCVFAAGTGLDRETLLAGELDPLVRAGFADRLAALGLDSAEYELIPVHPWQWWNRLAVTFAADLARRDLVWLGEAPDEYQAQQSIRTFFNTSVPHRHYVKTALSVLNMGFLRGLSAEYMAATPAINDWLAELTAGDPVLARAGFGILRERAAIGYRSPDFTAAAPKGSPYRKMLAALWRESPVPGLRPGERLATMASLLHVDRDGRSLAAALIAGSGLAAREWLRRYLDAYLVPVLHCFYAYDLVFMPHGENVILVLDGDVPVRVLFKDIAEEIVLMDQDRPLPEGVARIRAEVPPELKILSLFTDVFDGFLRFLNAILCTAGVLDEDAFWRTVADCAIDYQRGAPHLADRFAEHDLFAATFALSCLNRLQLRNNRQMVDLADPAGSLQIAGTLTNPIARYAGSATGPRTAPS